MYIVFDHAEMQQHGISTFWFRPEAELRYEPGQFIELYLPHARADERGERREFSLSSSPHEPLIAITTNFDFENGSTFKRELRKLKPGERVAVNEPMGDFVLPKDTSIPLVFVAAGLGCTPYVGMIKWLIERDEQRQIQLIYSVSQPGDFIFQDLWRNYRLDFIPVVTSPTADWHGETGRITASKLLELIDPVDDKLIYLAGPQSLIEPLFNDLLATGLTRAQVLLDYFPGY